MLSRRTPYNWTSVRSQADRNHGHDGRVNRIICQVSPHPAISQPRLYCQVHGVV